MSVRVRVSVRASVRVRVKVTVTDSVTATVRPLCASIGPGSHLPAGPDGGCGDYREVME